MNAARCVIATILIVIAAVLGEPEQLLGQPASQRQTVQAGPATLQVTIKGRGEPIVFIPSRGRGVEDFEGLRALQRSGDSYANLDTYTITESLSEHDANPGA